MLTIFACIAIAFLPLGSSLITTMQSQHPIEKHHPSYTLSLANDGVNTPLQELCVESYDHWSRSSHQSSRAQRSPSAVVINEFCPAPKADWDGDGVFSSTGDEWLELYNAGDTAVNISNWQLADETAVRQTIPDGTTLAPGGLWLTFGSTKSLSLGNSGDVVRLLDAEGTEVDVYCYEDTRYDDSCARRPDGNPLWTMLNDPTPGMLNGPTPNIIFNELMPNPFGSDTTEEWLELYNADTRPINITYWSITDKDALSDAIIDEPMIIPPDAYLLINTGPGEDDYDFSDGVAQLFMNRQRTQMMDNQGDDLVLCDEGELPVDYIAYGEYFRIDPPPAHLHWDGVWYDTVLDEYTGNLSNPNVIVDEGDSIALRQNGNDHDRTQDWANCTDTNITKGWNNNRRYLLDLDSDRTIEHITPGGTVSFELNLTNSGDVTERFAIEQHGTPPENWSITISPLEIDLAPNENSTLHVTLTAPDTALPGDFVEIDVTAMYKVLPWRQETARITAYVPHTIRINELVFDPEGADYSGDEWVELYNHGTAAVNMTGWVLTDQDGADDYVFPDLLVPQETHILIYMGYGSPVIDPQNGTYLLFANLTQGIWTNTGDDVLIMDTHGLPVDYIAYGASSSIQPPPPPLRWGGQYWDEPTDNLTGVIANLDAEEGSGIARVPGEPDTHSPLDWENRTDDRLTPGWSNSEIYSFSVSVDDDEPWLSVGATTQMTVTLCNEGNMPLVLKAWCSELGSNGNNTTSRWSAEFEDAGTVTLGEGRNRTVNLTLEAPPTLSEDRATTIVLSFMHTYPFKIRNCTLEPRIPAVELNISDLYFWSGELSGDYVLEGESVLFSAWLKNRGELNATDVMLRFYLDDISNETVVCEKRYDNIIAKRHRYPSFELDSLGLVGNHTLYAIVDPELNLTEPDRENNYANVTFSVAPTPPNASEAAVMITELYADTYLTNDKDSYCKLCNPTLHPIDLSGWQLSAPEGIIAFPEGTVLEPRSTMTIATSPIDYSIERCELPEFYFDDSIDLPETLPVNSETPPELMDWLDRGFQFERKSGWLVLSDAFRHTIDAIFFGHEPVEPPQHLNDIHGWHGPSVPLTQPGIRYLRIGVTDEFGELVYTDTNSSTDWELSPISRPRQSQFSPAQFDFNGQCTCFVSPDSSFSAISTALESAMFSIYLTVYQFQNPWLMEVLLAALDRGVQVKVFLEGAPVGTILNSQKYIVTALVEAGAQVRYMISEPAMNIHDRYDFVHAKYALIDNRTLIVMSENWVETGVPYNATMGNRGWGVVVENASLAGYFTQVFLSDWDPEMADSYPYTAEHELYGRPTAGYEITYAEVGARYHPRFPVQTISGNFSIQPVISPDFTGTSDSPILQMINDASSSVLVEQLDCDIYWGEDESAFLTAVVEAARRGCRVRVLLDSLYINPTDNQLDNADTVEWLNNIAAQEVLDLEAQLFYIDEMAKVHNKGVIVDGRSVLVSSINWVRNAVFMNREVGLVITNKDVAAYYTDVFWYDWNQTLKRFVEITMVGGKMREVAPGTTTQFSLLLASRVNYTLECTLHLEGLPLGWVATFSPTVVLLEPYGRATVSVAFTVPTDAEVGLSVEPTIYATGANMTTPVAWPRIVTRSYGTDGNGTVDDEKSHGVSTDPVTAALLDLLPLIFFLIALVIAVVLVAYIRRDKPISVEKLRAVLCEPMRGIEDDATATAIVTDIDGATESEDDTKVLDQSSDRYEE